MPMEMTLPSLLSFTGLAGLALLLMGAGAAAAVPLLKRARPGIAFGAAIALLGFQVFHLFEHLIQLGYWVMHPSARPYMTPWALNGVDGIAAWFDRLPGTTSAMAGGMEGLHLVGNVLFLVGIIALGASSQRRLPGLQTAFVFQGLHVAEHVLLTMTLWMFGTPLGVSTLFGAAFDYSWGGTLRVWFHFMINLGGTIPAAIALRSAVRFGRSTTIDLRAGDEPSTKVEREPALLH